MAASQHKPASASREKQPTALPALRKRPAWVALVKHHETMAGRESGVE